MKDIVLVESSTLRETFCTDENTQVLEQVGEIVYFNQTEYVTVKSVAQFYKVRVKTVENIVQRHHQEVKTDGYKVFSKKDLQNPHFEGFEIPNRGIALFPKRAVLRIGMLLRDSVVAKMVRSYLLNMEESALKQKSPHSTLTQMASQLTQQATALLNHANQLTGHADQINQNSIHLTTNTNQLQKDATQLQKNAKQLVSQSNMIAALAEEVCYNRERIKVIEKEMKHHHHSFVAFGEIPKKMEQSSISKEQIEILKARIKEKGNPSSIWPQFKKYFGITRYSLLPKKQFREALDWLESYSSKN